MWVSRFTHTCRPASALTPPNFTHRPYRSEIDRVDLGDPSPSYAYGEKFVWTFDRHGRSSDRFPFKLQPD